MMRIAESFVGNGPNAAHINLFLGPKNGPAGIAMASSAAAPRMGYIPFQAVLKPNVPVKPATLFAAKADLRGERHETMTWGPAQAGVAHGITKALLDGVLPPEAADGWCVIACVWVSWSADDADAVFRNNRDATYQAIARAMRDEPTLADVKDAFASPSNPFFTPRPEDIGSPPAGA